MNPEDLTPQEQIEADHINAAGKSADNLALALAALSASLALFFAYHQRRMYEETRNKTPDPMSLWQISARVFEDAKARLLFTVTPALVSAYIDGTRQGNAMRLAASPWMEPVAISYAEKMIDVINETSAEAMVSGYQAQLNRRIIARKALNNVVGAFGVPTRTMNTLVNLWSKAPGDPNYTSTPSANPLLDQIDHLVSETIKKRINQISETEVYSARATSKSIMWLYAHENGQLPDGTMKMWLTAKDERVCPVCGPMHRVRVRLDEQFTLPNGELMWGPGVHPNCRCDMRLASSLRDIDVNLSLEYDELTSREQRDVAAAGAMETVGKNAWGVVNKARGQDTFDRDNKGRFSSTESRTTTMEPKKADPRVAQILAQAEAMKTRLDGVLTGESVERTPAKESIQRKESIAAKESVQAKESIQRRESIPEKVQSSSQQAVSRESVSRSREGIKREGLSKESIANNKQALARMTEAIAAKAPEAIPATPKPSRKTSDKWVNTPNGQTWYGLVQNAGDVSVEGGVAIIDEDVRFYMPREGDARTSLSQAIQNYWYHFEQDELPTIFRTGSIYDEYDEESGLMILRESDEGEVQVPYESFQAAFRATAHGLTRNEVDDVSVILGGWRQSDEDDDTWEYEEDEDLINPLDLAEMMGLHETVADHSPTFIATDYFNADEGDAPVGGTATNPGRYRLLGGDLGQRQEWRYRDQNTPFGYRMFYAEPEDLYED